MTPPLCLTGLWRRSLRRLRYLLLRRGRRGAPEMAQSVQFPPTSWRRGGSPISSSRDARVASSRPAEGTPGGGAAAPTTLGASGVRRRAGSVVSSWGSPHLRPHRPAVVDPVCAPNCSVTLSPTLLRLVVMLGGGVRLRLAQRELARELAKKKDSATLFNLEPRGFHRRPVDVLLTCIASERRIGRRRARRFRVLSLAHTRAHRRAPCSRRSARAAAAGLSSRVGCRARDIFTGAVLGLLTSLEAPSRQELIASSTRSPAFGAALLAAVARALTVTSRPPRRPPCDGPSDQTAAMLTAATSSSIALSRSRSLRDLSRPRSLRYEKKALPRCRWPVGPVVCPLRGIAQCRHCESAVTVRPASVGQQVCAE